MGDIAQACRCFTFLAMWRRGKFEKQGLSCRRMGAGRYRFARSDRRPLDRIGVFVELTGPQASEMVMHPMAVCAEHGFTGFTCPHDPGAPPCVMEERIVEIHRWWPVVKLWASHFEVHLRCLPKMGRRRKTRGELFLKDADFAVQLVSRASEARVAGVGVAGLQSPKGARMS